MELLCSIFCYLINERWRNGAMLNKSCWGMTLIVIVFMCTEQSICLCSVKIQEVDTKIEL